MHGPGERAFVIDAFAGTVAGWECSLSKQTAFVERAVRQAAALRARQGRRGRKAIRDRRDRKDRRAIRDQ